VANPAENICEGCHTPLGAGRRRHAKHHGDACRQKAYRDRARAAAARRNVPIQLADLDVSRLSAAARNALVAGQEVADGASEADVAAAQGITVEALKGQFEQLRSEWLIHGLRAKFQRP
jgi:2-hydroxychromene-2-carboxylate isomerase